MIVDVQNTLVNNALLRWGTEEQKKRYLPRMATDTLGAYALSEAGSGSDAFALQTRAELKGTDYVLNGRKLWITNGKEAGLFVLFATVDPAAGYKGITAFLIDKDFPGFTVGKKEDKLGIRASSTCELILEDCRVPKENVLGEVGKGYKIAIETLNEGRIGIGAQMIGLARGAWEFACKYAQERKQFGKSIADFQGIQFQIAQMATEIEAARLMVYNCARMKDAGVNFVKEAAMTKLFCLPGGRARDLARASRSTVAMDLPRTIRSRSIGAMPRSERSTKARRTCSWLQSQSWCSGSRRLLSSYGVKCNSTVSLDSVPGANFHSETAF